MTLINQKQTHLVEVKLSEENLHPPLRYYAERLPDLEPIQLVAALKKPRQIGKIQVVSAADWLATLAL